jgi:hypothetical protein
MATAKEIVEIAVLQTQMVEVKAKLEVMERQQHTDHQEVIGKIDSLDGKFASKNVEKIVYGMVALVLIAFFTALIALVIIPQAKKSDTSTKTTTTTTTEPNSSGGSTSASTSKSTSTSSKPSDSQSVTDGVVDQVKKALP